MLVLDVAIHSVFRMPDAFVDYTLYKYSCFIFFMWGYAIRVVSFLFWYVCRVMTLNRLPLCWRWTTSIYIPTPIHFCALFCRKCMMRTAWNHFLMTPQRLHLQVHKCSFTLKNVIVLLFPPCLTNNVALSKRLHTSQASSCILVTNYMNVQSFVSQKEIKRQITRWCPPLSVG